VPHGIQPTGGRHVHEAGFEAHPPTLCPEEAVAPAVEVVRRQQQIAACQQLSHHRDGGHARRRDDGAGSTLELGDRVGELISRRIARAGVVVLPFSSQTFECEIG